MIIRKLNSVSRNSKIIVATWLALWFLPWQGLFESIPIIAIANAIFLFTLPGAFLYLVLRKSDANFIEVSIFGFAFSMFVFYLIGTAGRFFEFSFDLAVTVFFISGVIIILSYFFYDQDKPSVRFSKNDIPLALILIILVSISASFMGGARISDDDSSYLANITKWQHADPLNFNEVIFGTGFEGSTRYTLSIFPLIISLLSELSHVHGLFLISVYLRIVFIFFSMLSMYLLYLLLMKSNSRALRAVALHVLILALLIGKKQPGSFFFDRIVEDKGFAAYFVAPLFFLLLLRYLERRSGRRLLVFAIITITLSFTHPVTLAFSAMVAGLVALFDLILFRRLKSVLLVFFIILIAVLPHSFLLVSDHPSNTLVDDGGTIQANMYIPNSPFFSISPSILTMASLCSVNFPFICTYLYISLAAFGFFWSLRGFKKNDAARYTLASFIVVALCYFPYTGWLVAKLVSYRMLWRSPWTFPIGFSTWLLVDQLLTLAKPLTSRITNRFSNLKSYPIYVLVVIIAMLFLPAWKIKSIQDQKISYETIASYAALGNYFEKSLQTPTVIVGSPTVKVGTQPISNLIPGLASNAIPVVHRPKRSSVLATFAYFYSEEILKSRRVDNKYLFSKKKKSIDDRKIAILDKYEIQFLIFSNNYPPEKNQFLVQPKIDLTIDFDYVYLLEYTAHQ